MQNDKSKFKNCGQKIIVDSYQSKMQRAAELKNEECRLKICGAACGGFSKKKQ